LVEFYKEKGISRKVNKRGKQERPQEDTKTPSGPSHWIFLRNPFHNYTRTLRVG
jgi:hypothetical protein